MELGRYLCEVRAGQYWRLENLKSFDEYLERKFPESRRKAYYLMAIHEHLPKVPKSELKLMGWTKARELVKVVRSNGREVDCAPRVHNRPPQRGIQTRGGEALDGAGDRAVGDHPVAQALRRTRDLSTTRRVTGRGDGIGPRLP